MKNADLLVVSNFLRLLWVPSTGDRVIIRKDGRVLRGVVEVEHDGMYLISQDPGTFYSMHQLYFVPRKSDFARLLLRMTSSGAVWVHVNHSGDGPFRVTRRHAGGLIDIESYSTVGLVAGLLNARAVDPELNIIINEMVSGEKDKGSSVGIRLAPENLSS